MADRALILDKAYISVSADPARLSTLALGNIAKASKASPSLFFVFIMPGCFAFLKRSKSSTQDRKAVDDDKMVADNNQPASSHKSTSCACAFPHVEPAAGHASLLPPAYADLYHKSDALSTISRTVDELSDSLRKVSVQMHENPEIRWEEVETAKLLSGFMEDQGWKVTRHAYGTETGWEAVFEHGNGGKVIGFNSEVSLASRLHGLLQASS